MTEKFKTILNSLGSYPPRFVTDFSIYRNCYAHALNCMYEDRDYSVYSPGAICATFNNSDVFTDCGVDYYFREDLIIKLIKRDCSVLSIKADCCSFDSRTDENTYKIALTYSKKDNDIHFIRQNIDGLWSHKPGFGNLRHLVKSELICYHGESHIDIEGSPYKVIEIIKLQKSKIQKTACS